MGGPWFIEGCRYVGSERREGNSKESEYRRRGGRCALPTRSTRLYRLFLRFIGLSFWVVIEVGGGTWFRTSCTLRY